MKKRKAFTSAVNVFGFGLALAVFSILTSVALYELRFDAAFSGSERTYVLQSNISDADGKYSAMMSRPLISLAASASSHCVSIGSYWPRWENSYNMQENSEAYFSIFTAYADTAVLQIFDVDLLCGSRADFSSPSAAVIARSEALRVFGSSDVVGRSLFRSDGQRFDIVGVYADMPKNCTLPNGLIANLGSFYADDWSEWSFMPIVRVDDPSNMPSVQQAISDAVADLLREQGATDEELADSKDAFRLVQIHDAHFMPEVLTCSPTSHLSAVLMLLCVAVLVLVVAVINFVNFSFAQIPFDVKNINTRLIMGEQRWRIVLRKLGKAVLLALMSCAFAALLARVFSGSELASSLSFYADASLYVYVAFMSVAVASLSVLPSALYEPSFSPALALRGSYANGPRGKVLRSVLVGLQYVLSAVFGIVALYVGVQTRFMRDFDMGFDKEHVLCVAAQWGGHDKALAERLAQDPRISSVTFADAPIVAYGRMRWGRQVDGQMMSYDVLPVDVNFIGFFGLQVVDGRAFEPSDDDGEHGSLVINETMQARYPFLHVGMKIDDDEIVGVVKDFNHSPLNKSIEPLALYNWGRNKWRPYGVAYVRMSMADVSSTVEFVKRSVADFDKTTTPDAVNASFLDQHIENFYRGARNLGNLVATASLVALLIAAVGVVGLVFFETQFMRREIAVRRVNGASVAGIIGMFNRKYLVMAVASFAVAVPLAAAVIDRWRQGFAYQAPMPVWMFVVVLVGLCLLTVVVVTAESSSAASSDPSEVLRKE